jgi:DNA repair exonuclease SbcCD ATPase subunit
LTKQKFKEDLQVNKFVVFAISFVLTLFISSEFTFAGNIIVGNKTYTKTEIGELEAFVKGNIEILPGEKKNKEIRTPDANYIHLLEARKMAIQIQRERNILAEQINGFQDQINSLNQRNIELEKIIKTIQKQPLSAKYNLNNIYYLIIVAVALLFIAVLVGVYYSNIKIKELANNYAEKINSMDDQSKQLAEANVQNLDQLSTIEKLNKKINELETKVNVLNQNNGIVKQPNKPQEVVKAKEQLETIRRLETERMDYKNQAEKSKDAINELEQLVAKLKLDIDKISKNASTQKKIDDDNIYALSETIENLQNNATNKDVNTNQANPVARKQVPAMLDLLNKST